MKRPPWYAKPRFIRQRKNHSWTNKELKKVYNMRVQRIPVDLIINKLHLHVKRTQIYNIIRMMKKNFQGRCPQCGENLTKKEILTQDGKIFKICSKCQEKNSNYKKNFRISLHDNGLCTCCGKRPPLKNKKTCMYCLSYTHRNRIAKGLCGACGAEPLSPKSRALGEKCLIFNRLSSYRKERVYANS